MEVGFYMAGRAKAFILEAPASRGSAHPLLGERVGVQMGKGQTMYENRSLSPNPQQPAQETIPPATVTSPGRPPAANQMCRKSDREAQQYPW